jgi:Tfp pilus assembly protein PilF
MFWKKSLFLSVLCVGLLFTRGSFAAESERLMERAKNLYGVQEYSAAKVFFEKTIALDPENGEAWDYASWCERYLGNWERAEEGFKKAKNLLPGDLSKWVEVGLGETYLGAGAFEKSTEAFDRAMELAPDDEELVVRALKGLVFAYASLGDSPKVEETLERLARKNPEEAAGVRDDAASIIETYRIEARRKSEAADSKSAKEEEEELSNTMERQSQAAERVTPERKSTEDSFVSIWSLKLGAPMEEALATLEAQGIKAIELEETTILGSRFYVTKLPNEEPLLDWVDKEVGVSFHLLEEYQGKLLRVTVVCGWKRNRGGIAFKERVFDSMAAALETQYDSCVHLKRNSLYTEALWIPRWNHLTALDMTVSLDGQVYLSLTHGHLPGLLEFWDNAKKILDDYE